MIAPASSYHFTEDLCIITCFFNSEDYITKRKNFEMFIEPIRAARLNYLVVECSFKNTFSIPGPNVVRVRSKSILWQKERLLNKALEFVPPHCTKIAWVDCDLLFANPDWALDTSLLLDSYPVVQLFDLAIRLPRGRRSYDGVGECYPGFASVYAREPNLLLEGQFARHGHTGFAWAARKDLLLCHGLYDACIAGSGDHFMAHAFCGDWSSTCIRRIMEQNKPYYDHFVNWCERMYSDVRARLVNVPGVVLHLWHGEMTDLRYSDRNYALNELLFNPFTDLKLSRHGAWEIQRTDRALHRWAKEYFQSRKEDG